MMPHFGVSEIIRWIFVILPRLHLLVEECRTMETESFNIDDEQ